MRVEKQTLGFPFAISPEMLSVTTLSQMLAAVARANPSQTAVVDGQTTVSYAEFRERFPKSPTGKIRRDLLNQKDETFQ